MRYNRIHFKFALILSESGAMIGTHSAYIVFTTAYFPAIGPYTKAHLEPVLPEIFLVRIDVLRALSQVCIDYRRAFLTTSLGLTQHLFYDSKGQSRVVECLLQTRRRSSSTQLRWPRSQP